MMTVSSYVNLDEELNLFEEDLWDFFNPQETNRDNFEFFEPTYVETFTDPKSYVNPIYVGTFILLLIVTVAYFGVSLRSLFDEDYVATKSVASYNYKEDIIYVEGTDCSNEDVIEISQLLTAYTRVLDTGKGYNRLNDYCADKDSNFLRTYNSYCDNIKYSFDTDDCYARLMQAFGKTIDIIRIDRVIEKEGVYYCYVNMSIPTSTDIHDYIYLYSYNMTKYFTSNDVTQANVVNYLLDMLEYAKISCTNDIYCFRVIRQSNGILVLEDDTVITNLVKGTYTEAVSQMSEVLGNKLR